jgi:predicted dehydrogenase
MKILISGVGSIGERHIGNLISLGYDDIILHRRNNTSLRSIKETFPTYKNLDDALKLKPDVAFICCPTAYHIDVAIKCAEMGCHLFIEKPISNNLLGKEKLYSYLKSTQKVVMIGYMMRYHPCILKIKSWLDLGLLGKCIGMRSTWGEYLPDWHPWEDYKESYAAKKSMGGGPTLTLNHDIDLAIYLFGNIKSVTGCANSESNLEMDVEHYIDVLVRFKSGMTGNIHLDFVQKPPQRKLEIIGTNGRIEFDYYKGEVIFLNTENDIFEKFKVHEKFNRNDLFIAELEDFFESINKKNSLKSLDDAYHSLECSLKALSNNLL